jgi:hypothetical protein
MDLDVLLLQERIRMARTLQILFRRDPSRDRQLNNVPMDGFELLWLDRSPVGYAFDAFCYHAQRILSLNRFLVGYDERLMEVVLFPRNGREDELVRLKGLKVRRLQICRQGRVGRIHLLNGAPTEITFEIGRDEARVIEWAGLNQLRDGESLWFDLTARPVETLPKPPARTSEKTAHRRNSMPAGS